MDKKQSNTFQEIVMLVIVFCGACEFFSKRILSHQKAPATKATTAAEIRIVAELLVASCHSLLITSVNDTLHVIVKEKIVAGWMMSFWFNSHVKRVIKRRTINNSNDVSSKIIFSYPRSKSKLRQMREAIPGQIQSFHILKQFAFSKL